MKKGKFILTAFVAVMGILFSTWTRAAELSAEADAAFWWTIYEDNENGVLQQGSLDKAAQTASGFSLNRARISLYPDLPEYKLYSRVQVQLQDDVQLLDTWLSYRPNPLLNLYIGQMKVPSTYEVAIDEPDLDFIVRTTYSASVVNWTMIKTPYYGNPFRDSNAHYRDMGMGLKGAWDAGQGRDVFRYFIMVGNGLGANMNISSQANGDFVSNKFGQYFYGVRAEVMPFEWMTIGGHFDYNYHSDILYNDRKTVYDFNRNSWSADCRLKLPWGFLATGMYGQGVIDDDWLRTGKKDYEYSGWEAKVLKEFFNDKLELGVRYDTFSHESNESGEKIDENHWTFGINYRPVDPVRLQLNYVIKDTVDPYAKDLNDNIVYLNIEMDIYAGLGKVALKKK